MVFFSLFSINQQIRLHLVNQTYRNPIRISRRKDCFSLSFSLKDKALDYTGQEPLKHFSSLCTGKPGFKGQQLVLVILQGLCRYLAVSILISYFVETYLVFISIVYPTYTTTYWVLRLVLLQALVCTYAIRILIRPFFRCTVVQQFDGNTKPSKS